MKKNGLRRFTGALLALALVLTLLPLTVWAAPVTYTVDISEMDSKPKGTWANGDTFQCGTDGYFTVFCSETTRIDGSSKSFSDGHRSTKRLNFNSGTKFGETILNAVQIKTTSPAQVTLWWVSGGDDREVAIYAEDGTVLQQTTDGSVKNSPYIARFHLPDAGTYYIGNVGGNNNYVRIDVTEDNPAAQNPRAPWDQVSAPTITAAADDGKGDLEVTVRAEVGHNGGDQVTVTMVDALGQEIARRSSVLERSEHTLVFSPAASGTYSFRVSLAREGEAPLSGNSVTAPFLLPLEEPVLVSATSKGGGTAELQFTAVAEAEVYEVFQDGSSIGTTTDTVYLAKDLTVGQEYRFQVKAIRGAEGKASNTLSVTATRDEKATWAFTHYGPSTNSDNNGYVGNLNEDGAVTVYSENGKGKIVPGSVDGLAFYYTAVPTTHNFTLRAKVTVDSWAYSNGQEGFGLLATDRLGKMGDTGNFWNNQYMAVATKIEYRYNPDTMTIQDINGSGTRYSMKLGLGSIAKTGVTPENLPLLDANDTGVIAREFLTQTHSLEDAAGFWEKEAGTYNIIGSCTNEVSGSIDHALLTEFVLEIQKNNAGYFITYYDADGNILCRNKYYGADSLNRLDGDYVYVGFFAARNARATFTDVSFTTVLCEEDAPAEEKPLTLIEPTLVMTSATVTTNREYTLSLDASVAGALEISVGGKVAAENVAIQGGVRLHRTLSLPEYGDNRIQVTFTPDPNQDLGPDTALSGTDKVYLDATVTCNRGFYHTKTLYVGPDGQPNGDGSREYPLDIHTAVNNATAGQTIVLLEGTYKLRSTVRIQRGMDGTEDAPIRMIADPEAATRPVLDFQGECAGIVHGGDWWYFAGFDVTNSAPTQKGFQVSGNHNVLDQIHAYRNGNTGIQISRYSGTDLFPDWPANNLILNCTSYLNADPGEEDADGFAAKLTCGEGNVFDGCVAYNNADDGWDLYAKLETGAIGAVTVRGCIAYSNGLRQDGTPGGGNGNGFKLGGESLSGKHILENSYAFFNKSKGIDSNSCPDVTVRGCVSYNNGTYNVALYTNNAQNTAFTASGILSFKDGTSPFPDSLSQGDNLKPRGTQAEEAFRNGTTYYWDGAAAVNGAGKAITAEAFRSLTFQGVVRNPDGTWDLQGFLDNSLISQSAGTPSRDMTTLPDSLPHSFGDTWYNLDNYFHWHECECGARGSYGAHDLHWVVDREATPDKPGSKHEQCTVCGHKKPSIETYYEAPTPEPTDAPTEPLGPTGADRPEDSTMTYVLRAAAVCILGFVVKCFLSKKK